MDLSALQGNCPLPTRQPSSFRPAGEVKWAEVLAEAPSFTKRGRMSGARARGISYEGKALKMLAARFGAEKVLARGVSFVAGPWYRFVGEGGVRYCQPDAIALDMQKGIGVVYEVKYSHCAEAWFQIWKLYVPVLQKMYPDLRFFGCEICKWFDPNIGWPQAPAFTPDPLEFPGSTGRTYVHIWNPARDL